VSWGLDPFEDVDGAYCEAYSICDADVEVNGYLGPMYAELSGRFDLSSYLVLIMGCRKR
jgi:hypothetical protein